MNSPIESTSAKPLETSRVMNSVALLTCAGLIAFAPIAASLASDAQSQTSAPAATASKPTPKPTPASPYQPDRFAGKAARYYAEAWGIDGINIKLVESGEMIRFTYRVVDPKLAAPLNDKRLTPALVDEVRGVSLVVPQMENVGMLRQTSDPKANKLYWVAFSNKGRVVKRGDRVDVVIGPFHANNLVVD